MNNNNFYLLKGQLQKAVQGKFNKATGEYESATSEIGRYCTHAVLSNLKSDKRASAIFGLCPPDLNFLDYSIYYFDKAGKYLGYTTGSEIPDKFTANNSKLNAYYVTCDFKLDITESELAQMTSDEVSSMLNHVWVYAGFKLQEPHYSKLEKKYKKETGQVFFRNTLEGSIKIFGDDYDYINAQDLETKYLLVVTNNSDKILAYNSFSKADCKLDNMRHSIELKLSAIDKYSKILNKYDNTYDLIKLSPAITPLTLTKRLLYQFYIQGANSVSCYANGIYWEQDVNEAIDNVSQLRDKYHFAANRDLQELEINQDQLGADYAAQLAGTYTFAGMHNDSYRWLKIDDKTTYLALEPLTATEKAKYGTRLWDLGDIYNAATGEKPYFTTGESEDGLYRFVLYSNNGKFAFFKSSHVYCTTYKELPFDGTLYGGSKSDYTMIEINEGTAHKSFNLKDSLIFYPVWARILADVESYTDSDGNIKTLYDLPKDDFISERVNYRKCIGITNINLKQSSVTVKHPTKYGRNDSGEYFTSNNIVPPTETSHLPVPISRSSWANTSIWAIIPDSWSAFEAKFRTSFILKDAFSLADVIKSLLHKIDPLVKFEATSQYSEFLYGNVDVIQNDSLRDGYVPFITPKSNVLKGNYDQAAQKAEITFEQIMNMLRDCFRCYWYIDEKSNLRIEHISYFMNGLSYDGPDALIDLTTKKDKFNRKLVLYAQESVSYSKDDLSSRYEFNWMDDSTDIFEDIEMNVNSVYIQENKTEEINSEVFSTDVDLMLYAPDKFSSDGFALLMADKVTHKVPIFSIRELRDDEYLYGYSATPQNYLCSWLYLARYYMLDMPAKNMEYTRAPLSVAFNGFTVQGVKQFMQQDVEFQTKMNINPYSAITTSVGTGIIDSMSINLDTQHITATLAFKPTD